MTEGLLDHDAGVASQSGFAESLNDPAEEERRDLEVEDRALLPVDRLPHPRVRLRVSEIAGHIREPVDQPIEDVGFEPLTRAFDRGLSPLAEIVERPVVDRHSDDRAVEEP